MQAYNLERFIRNLDVWGVSDVLLPFILLFVIFYGILTKAEVISKSKGVNIGLSFVIALTPVILHVTNAFPGKYDPIEIINQAIPGIAMVAVAMIMFLIFVGLFGGKTEFNYASIGVWTVAFVLFFIVNTVWYNNYDVSFFISMVIMVIAIFVTFYTGFPGLYEIITAFSICFILYMFGRTVGWFSEMPRWVYSRGFVGSAVTIFILFWVIGYAMKPEGGSSGQSSAPKLEK